MTALTSSFSTYVLPEWRSMVMQDITLSAADRRLAAQLSVGGMDSRLAIDELRDGLRVTSRSWVGVVRFHHFEIQVVPKLVGDNLDLVDLIDFAAGIDALRRFPAVRTLKGTGTCLFDLISLLLVEACEHLVRGGFLYDYVEHEDAIPVLRGRFLGERQMLKRFGRIDHLECRYDEHVTNIAENRILLAALTACAGRIAHSDVAMRVRRMLAIVSEVCDLDDLDLRHVRSSLVYGRMNERYRDAHELAWMIIDGLGIEDLFASGSPRCFAFLLDMNSLFEGFVTRWLRHVLATDAIIVTSQRRDRTILWNALDAKPYASVIPDLVVEWRDRRGPLLPMDAKYKLYDQKNVSPGDIYQSFLYAFAFGERHANLPTAILLHPASAFDSPSARIQIRRSGGTPSAQLDVLPIHIPTALVEARSKRLGAVGKALRQLVVGSLSSCNAEEVA